MENGLATQPADVFVPGKPDRSNVDVAFDKTLDDRIAELSLARVPPDDIAKVVGLTPNQVLRKLTSPSFGTALERVRRISREAPPETVFQQHMPVAQSTVLEVMITGQNRDRLTAAFGWMDRSGPGPRTKQDVNFRGILMTGHMTEDDLQRILLRRLEAMKEE